MRNWQEFLIAVGSLTVSLASLGWARPARANACPICKTTSLRLPLSGIFRMPNSPALAHRAAIAAAIANLGLLIAPTQLALADKPSTSVIVTNPGTNPALTSSVDDPGRIPYQNQLAMQCILPDGCISGNLSVPAGMRLVVQHLAVEATMSEPARSVRTVVAVSGAFTSGFSVPLLFNGLVALGDQPVQFYVDGKGSLLASLDADALPAYAYLTLTGYLLDCTVNQCAPISP